MKALEFYQTLSGLSQPAIELGRKDIRNAKQKAKATTYMQKVAELLAFVNQKKESDKPFNVSDLQKMMTNISDVRIALKGLSGITSNDMIDKTSKQIAEIEKVVALLDVNQKLTLTEAVNSTEIVNVELEQKADQVGGNSSVRSRIKVKNAKDEEIKGFFTEENVLFDESLAKNIEAKFKAAMESNPRNRAIKNFYQKLTANKRGVYILFSGMKLDKKELPTKNPDEIAMRDAYDENRMRYYGFLGESTPIESMDDELKAILLELRAPLSMADVIRMKAQNTQFGDFESSGIKAVTGSSKSGRNIAVSNVANILGIPNAVAKAVPVTVKDNGKEVRGVFMREAKGLDFVGDNELYKTDFMLTDEDSSLNGPVLKQIADLQVLDYICQNVDRHANNMFYSLDKNGNIVGVQGIDNDMSFGTRKFVDTMSVQHGTPLHNITVISKPLADTIKKLQPETLAAALSDVGLKEEEIKAACERLEKLKKHITKNLNTKNELRAGKIKIVGNDEWGTRSLTSDNLAITVTRARGDRPSTNLFYMAQAVIDHCKGVRKVMHDGKRKLYQRRKKEEYSKQQKKEITYAQSKPINELSVETIEQHQTAFYDFYENIAYNENEIADTATGYADLKKALTDVVVFQAFVKKAVEPMDEALNAPEKHLEKEELRAEHERTRWQYVEKLLALKEAAAEYIKLNQVKGENTKEISIQVENAKEILEYTSRHESIFQEASLHKQEEELDAIHAELMKEQHQFDSIVGAIATKVAEKFEDMSSQEAIDIILNAPILKALTESDDSLSILSEMAENNPDALYKLYTSMAIQKGKEAFADDTHKALIDIVLNEKEAEAAKVEEKKVEEKKDVVEFQVRK